MFRTISTPFAAAVFLLLASSSHAQQSRPERPYRGLFGGGDAESQQGLTVSGSIGGGYDTNLAEDARDATQLSVPGTELRRSGTLGQFSGSVSYALARETAAFSASAGTTGRYYPSGNHRRIVRRDSAGLQGSTRIGGGVSVYGSAGYSPYRVSDLYAALLVPTAGVASDDFDFGTSAEHFFSYSGGASGGWPLSRRVSVDATYGYGGRAASSRIPGYSSHRAGGGLRYNIGRGLDLNLGYTYA
ncbi:MAG TPA: hypothetical protein VFZ73_13025, partial [Gemmatimonadaceae bacterium]